jgi:hypothetical protein
MMPAEPKICSPNRDEPLAAFRCELKTGARAALRWHQPTVALCHIMNSLERQMC